jgi:preprotein translocase subunit SecG
MLLTFTMSILLGILTFILIIVSVLLVLLVLMQKSKSDGGVGAALGGGMTESAFGADTNNVLSKSTINATIIFFVLSFVLYLGHIYQRNHGSSTDDALPSIAAPIEVAPAADASAPAAVTVDVPASAASDSTAK